MGTSVTPSGGAFPQKSVAEKEGISQRSNHSKRGWTAISSREWETMFVLIS